MAKHMSRKKQEAILNEYHEGDISVAALAKKHHRTWTTVNNLVKGSLDRIPMAVKYATLINDIANMVRLRAPEVLGVGLDLAEGQSFVNVKTETEHQFPIALKSRRRCRVAARAVRVP